LTVSTILRTISFPAADHHTGYARMTLPAFINIPSLALYSGIYFSPLNEQGTLYIFMSVSFICY